MTPENLVLSCLRTGEETAWVEFIRRFQPLVAGTVLRTARQWGEDCSQVLDDLVQESFLKLCANQCRMLREFQLRHPDSIFGFLKVVTANVVHDYFKALHAAKRGSGIAAESLDSSHASAAPGEIPGIHTAERELLLKEIDAFLSTKEAGPASARDRAIFWLYYRQGLTAEAIASVPWVQLTTKGVESTIFRMTRTVRQHVTRRFVVDQRNASDANPAGIRLEESL